MTVLDAKKLLDDIMGAGQAQMNRHGYAGQGKGLATGALAGGLAGLLLGSKKGRKLAKKAAVYGGLAAVAGLAWTAWQRRNAEAQPASNAGMTPVGAPVELLPPPKDTPFDPGRAPGGEQSMALILVVAMIAAAKADGHIDAEEQTRVFANLDQLELDAEEKAFVMDELRAPVDIDRIVRFAESQEQAAEIYAASLLAMEPDQPAERAYLDLLAARLGLDAGLTREIEDTVGMAARQG
ncbi:Inner membrane protein YebE [Hartmannibacter diazotrophicus]|uniref:Inner membrane protein YebE n=1 Tax=Hartmannibacter diazotrophicus TaxID=1482074 RepID=A0A2C9DBE5_9HYPH|nr:tellurite resistance TerB family protein [Hartmannibacter diazotrophicus]SON57644.1 Inner membrane protein YebE [Hartmannibacter diazotrophicus]